MASTVRTSEGERANIVGTDIFSSPILALALATSFLFPAPVRSVGLLRLCFERRVYFSPVFLHTSIYLSPKTDVALCVFVIGHGFGSSTASFPVLTHV